VFAEEVGLKLEDDRLEIPGGKTYVEGEDECDGKPGVVQVAVWDDPNDESPEVVTEDVTGIKLGQNQLLTVAFAPEDADLSKPPSAPELAAPKDLQQSTVPSVPVTPAPDGSTTSTAPAGTDSSTTTTAPADSTTTSAP
jgi:hypothetical protein